MLTRAARDPSLGPQKHIRFPGIRHPRGSGKGAEGETQERKRKNGIDTGITSESEVPFPVFPFPLDARGSFPAATYNPFRHYDGPHPSVRSVAPPRLHRRLVASPGPDSWRNVEAYPAKRSIINLASRLPRVHRLLNDEMSLYRLAGEFLMNRRRLVAARPTVPGVTGFHPWGLILSPETTRESSIQNVPYIVEWRLP